MCAGKGHAHELGAQTRLRHCPASWIWFLSSLWGSAVERPGSPPPAPARSVLGWVRAVPGGVEAQVAAHPAAMPGRPGVPTALLPARSQGPARRRGTDPLTVNRPTVWALGAVGGVCRALTQK